MTIGQRISSLAFGVFVLAGTLITPMSGATILALTSLVGLIAMIAYLGRKLIPGFYPMLGKGLLAGLAAGVLVLGPLFRGAMRVVNLMDPSKPEEFTIDGTLFIVIFVGAILGTTIGVAMIFFRTALGSGRRVGSLLAGLMVIGFLLLSPDLRGEVIEFGGGPWVNIPLFFAAGYLYGEAGQWVFDKLRRRTPRPTIQAPLEPVQT